MTENLAAYRYYALGLANAGALQTKEAIALFQKAFELHPGFVMAQARIGYAYAVTDAALADGRPYLESAYRNSSKLTDKDRRHIVAWYAIANQDYQGAIRGYSELIAEYPNEPEAYLRLAVLLRGESRHEKALELLRQAASIDASDPQVYNHRSAVLSEMGRHQDAIAMASHYVTLAPNDPNSYDSLALAFQSGASTTTPSRHMGPRFGWSPILRLPPRIAPWRTGRWAGNAMRSANPGSKPITARQISSAGGDGEFWRTCFGAVESSIRPAGQRNKACSFISKAAPSGLRAICWCHP